MINVDDIGAIIRITPSDSTVITGAIESSILYQKPSGSSGTWAANVVTNGLEYVTQDGDIDEAGTWNLQGFVDIVTWRGTSNIVTIEVGKKIEVIA